jgi:hypothetical protein
MLVTHKYPIPGDRQIPEIGRSVLETGHGNPSGQTVGRPECIEAMPVSSIRWCIGWPSAGSIQ